MLDKKNIINIYPLTPLQEGMLFREQMSGPGAYIMQSRFIIEGALDSEIFEQSWNFLIQRHEALRTLIAAEGADRPLQIVLRKLVTAVETDDCSGMEESECLAFIEKRSQQEIDKGFDLKQAPLFRIRLFRMSSEKNIFLFTFHHIIMDGWCQGILHEELLATYSAFHEKRQPVLPATTPFSRYVKYLDGQDRETGLSFWREKLEGFEPSSAIGWTKKWKKQPERFSMDVLEFTLPETSVRNLRKLAAECSTTLNAALQALWGITICALSGKRDIAWGTVVSGRPPELIGSGRTLGLFINTIPMRVRLAKESSFRTILTETGAWLAGSIAHQHLPLADIGTACGITAPLFDHLMIFENYPVTEESSTDNHPLSITPDSRLSGHTDYDIVFVADSGDEIDCFLKYNAALIDDKTAALIRDALIALATQTLDDSDSLLADMQILPENVLHDMIHRFPPGEILPGDNRTFPELFDACAARYPNRTAVIAVDGTMTYHELEQASNAIAESLIRGTGIQESSPVALMTGRNLSMLPSIIGIMKAGAVFVPLDPSYPDERISFILGDSKCGAVLAEEKHHHRFKEYSIPILSVESVMVSGESDRELLKKVRPDENDAAYIIYTSGSTGTPKGVVAEHRNVSNFINGYSAAIPGYRDSALRIAFVANYVFDASGRAFYPSLCHGHTVTIADENTRLDPVLLIRFLSDNAVDILDCTPSLVNIALESDTVASSLKRMVLGGEALKRITVEKIYERYPEIAITNVYGPTETTIDSSFCHLDTIPDSDGEIAPIGRALPNQQIYVLDDRLSPLSVGAEGEICIGGNGIVRGYLNRDDLTEKAFVDDPFNPSGKLYKTGDKGYWRDDGLLCFSGRQDEQVKIRGFRIEPGEIETAITTVPDVRQCAAIVINNSSGDKNLQAFFTSSGELDAETLRNTLSKKLPSHMIPSVIIRLEQIPLTPSGKIDRMKLLQTTKKETQNARQTPMQNSTSHSDQIVLDTMKSVLGVTTMQSGDNFFERGGHSLLSVRLCSLIAKNTGQRLPVSAVYRYPTALALGAFIDRFDSNVQNSLSDFHIDFNDYGTPLYCFPPYGGSGLVYQRLAAFLKNCRRLVCYNYLKDVDFVSETAAHILTEARHAPVTLLGYSGGGNLAFETSQAIERAKGQVDKIIMLDSYCRLETVNVPISRHEREMREILDSEEYAVYFSDTAAREAAVLNGTAYAEYLYSGVESGMVSANISVISAADNHLNPTKDRFGMLRSQSAWKNKTKAAFEIINGDGNHGEMLDGLHCENNAAIIRNILRCNQSEHSG